MLNWLMLYIAITLEVAGTLALKSANGFSRPVIFAAAPALYGISFTAISAALRTLPVGTSYAIWSGVGTLMAVLMGVLLFTETLTLLRAFFILLILIGTIGLNLMGDG